MKKAIGFLMLMFLALVAMPSVSYAAEQQQNTNVWEMKSDMLSPRRNFQAEVIDGKIYALGGLSNSGTSNTIEVYDPSTDTWTNLAPMPTARYSFQSEVINGKIYTFGGHNGSTTFNNTEVYDPSSNIWISLAPMPTARYSFKTEVIGGKIHLIGGYNSLGSVRVLQLDVYDPTNDTWTTLAPMPSGKVEPNTEVIGSKIYVIGGTSGDFSSSYAYDLTSDTWTTLAPMPTNRGYCKTEVVNGKIYVIGGLSGSTTYKNTDMYDPITDTWKPLKSMINGRANFETMVIQNKIYAIGGNSNNTTAGSMEVYDLINDTWTALSPMFTGRQHFQTVFLNDKLFALGGASSDGNIKKVEAYAVEKTGLLAPANLTANPGNAKVDLSWTAVDDATSYIIKRSETAGGPYTTVSSVTGLATTFTDTGLTNGKTYYYVVTAVNLNGESENSNEVSATPMAPANVLKLVLEVKEQKQLSVADDLGKNTDMIWASSDTAIATVDVNGLVKALKPGNTVITCTSKDGDYTETIKVLVVDLDLQLAVDLFVGETCRFTVDDAANTANVIWTSYNPAIATVTNKGKVAAVSEGLTYITATDSEGKEIGRIYIRVRQ